jgi:phage terminase large subunit GpA-like protein
MMLVHMAQHTAREWSQQDLERMLRHSPKIREQLVPGRQNDNVYDKKFLSGMRIEVTWPTPSNLSGKTYRYTFIFDYDREPIVIAGEGDKWGLTFKRGETFGRYRMHVAETSPGHPVKDAKWVPPPGEPHAAPPCDGLLSVYNESDRRRWYWRCPQCHEAFEPHRRLLNYPDSKDPMECAEGVTMICPHDGFPMLPDMQHELNLGGRWVKEGQVWIPDARLVGPETGEILGEARRSNIAGFWMFGPAAGFTDWKKLVYRLRVAEQDYERNGGEDKLKTCLNTDFGEPHVPKNLAAGRLPEELKARAREWSERGTVPPGVGFLVTTIDVQAGGRPSFVWHTYGIGTQGVTPEQAEAGDFSTAADIWHVDMGKIRKSERLDGDGERKLIDPAAYPEDWDLLTDAVLLKTYPLSDGSGRRMAVKITACDSGGAAAGGYGKRAAAKAGEAKISVTANAYEYWRRLKKDPEGRQLHLRFHLVKGEKSDSAPEIHKSFPDSQQKDKFAIARGDVPIWKMNSDKLKDRLSNKLGRIDPGGRINFPLWRDDEGGWVDIGWLYQQLTAEVRTARGWENPGNRRNEAFDLLYYCLGVLLHPDIRVERIDWRAPPSWADPDWDRNSLVFLPGGAPSLIAPPKRNIADLGKELG